MQCRLLSVREAGSLVRNRDPTVLLHDRGQLPIECLLMPTCITDRAASMNLTTIIDIMIIIIITIMIIIVARVWTNGLMKREKDYSYYYIPDTPLRCSAFALFRCCVVPLFRCSAPRSQNTASRVRDVDSYPYLAYRKVGMALHSRTSRWQTPSRASGGSK